MCVSISYPFALLCEKMDFSNTAPMEILALIATILVPFAIFLADKNERAFPFDKELILKKLFGFKWLVGLALLSSVTLAFECKILNLSVVFCLLLYFIVIGVRLYRWFCSRDGDDREMTYRQKLRLDYLKSLKGDEKIQEVWSLLLSGDDFSKSNQTGIIDVFLEVLEKRLEEIKCGSEKDWEVVDALTMVLLRNIDKIHFVPRAIFERMTAFSISYFKQLAKYSLDDEVLPPLGSLRDLFYKLTSLATADNDDAKMLRFLLFRTLKDSLMRESKESDADEYELVVLQEVFEALRKSGFSTYDMWTWDAGFWGRFIVKDSRTIKGTLIMAYREQVRELMLRRGLSNEHGIYLANLTNLLFPKVKLTVWFDLLTFVNWRTYIRLEDKTNLYSKIVDWCKYRRGFGLTDGYRRFGGNYGFYGEDKDAINRVFEEMAKEDNEDFEETIYLLKAVCGLSFDKASCEAILDEIAKIKKDGVFDDNSYERAKLDELESHIKRIIDLFNRFDRPWWNKGGNEDGENDGSDKHDDEGDGDDSDNSDGSSDKDDDQKTDD